MGIYLDNNAFTHLDGEVRKSISDFFDTPHANPSSHHRLGQHAKALLIQSTKSIASYFNVRQDEVIFTSGATEALNMVIAGIKREGHIISSDLEHQAVLHPLKHLESRGRKVTYLKGLVTLDRVKMEVREDTSLIVLMACNNETGIKTDIASIAAFAKEKGILCVVDGVALLGKEVFHIPDGVSAICFSSHKIHGPSGIGLAIVKKGIPFNPLIWGGNQQRGKRGGTENMGAIIGLAKAIERLKEILPEATWRMATLRNRLEEGISAKFPQLIIHGKGEERVCNISNMAFPGIDGEILLFRLDMRGLFVSTGAACSSGGIEPSHVLLNMGIDPEIASSSLRFSLSRYTTEDEIEKAIEIINEEIYSLLK